MGLWWWMIACGGSSIYAPCESADECPAPEEVTAECVDKSGVGFCTWECAKDEDCAFDEDAYPRVCASFESESELYCFPSCEGAETDDPDACPPGYGCRSTGGGSDNRKICFPGEGELDNESPDPAG
jgi:hypothetical protein